MITTSVIRSGVWRWRSQGKLGSKSLQPALRKVFRTLEASAITIGVAVSCLAMFVPIPFIHSSSNKPTTTATKSTPKKSGSNIVQNSGASASMLCKASDANAIEDFASCPGFVLDYSKVPNGLVSDKYFNFFIGRSEANDEAQIYTASPQNLRVENGSLVLEAQTSKQAGTRYTSARIDTKGKKDFQYGKFVFRAKMPKGVGTWPAIWMLPSQPRYARLNPGAANNYLSDGEIDIAEAIGSQPYTVYAVAHSLSYDNNGVDRTYFDTVTVNGNDSAFHDYEVDWTPTNLTFKVDGKTFYAYAKPAGADYRTWPYDQPFYLIMNLAVGGTWAGQDREDFPLDGVDASALPTSLDIQSVHYYPYVGPKQ